MNTTQQAPVPTACAHECITTSLILGSISLGILASALGCLFAAWKCRDQSGVTGGARDSKPRFDIVATSGCTSAKTDITAAESAGADAV